MTSYQDFVQGIMRRLGLSSDACLSTIATTLRVISYELSSEEALVFRRSIAPELRQLVVRRRKSAFEAGGSVPAARDGKRIVALVATYLEISEQESRKRVAAVLDELRSGVSPWDDVSFAETLHALQAENNSLFVQAAVA